ncbi:MAG: ribokinase [Acidobacteria bacterium]|nr:ribokinase [Acidobacteriota bacterium]
MEKTIVVAGSINMDMVASVERMPATGETVSGNGFATHPGGKGANQAVAAARLGAPVKMIGRLGNDSFGSQLRQQLEADRIDTSSVAGTGLPSGCAVILVDRQGANSIVVIPGANGALYPSELAQYEDTLRDAAIVLAQLEVPLETVVRLAEMAHAMDVPFVLDPAPAQPLPAALLNNVTWLTPNESEARSILRDLGHTGDAPITPQTAPAAAERILATGVRNVILKMGSQGAYLSGRDTPAACVPAFSVETVDTTAAGDAFNGGFAYALTQERMKPYEAVRFASAVAALSVTRRGAQPSMPNLDEVVKLFRS